MSEVKHVILIMVDGLGLPPAPVGESVYGQCPTIVDLLTNHSVPLDACLGVEGLPQSATGQTTILTGVNAAAALGGHLHGFPNQALRRIIERQNLFRRLLDAGVSCTFANAYALDPEKAIGLKIRSVTTVATESAFGKTRTCPEMLAGGAVYHDLTRQWLAAKVDFEVPLISETTAAEHLLAISQTVGFCLFEYFLTDLTAHRGTDDEKLATLLSLDRFLNHLTANLDRRHSLLTITSDHGNIEEPQHRRHTANPVPFCTVGSKARESRENMRDLTDITPRIVDLLTG